MANEDARDSGVLGKALGMAAVVGGVGAGGYFGGKALMGVGKAAIKGGKKAVNGMTDAWSSKGFKTATKEGAEMFNGVKNHTDDALKNVMKDSASISKDYTTGEGSHHIISNAIAEGNNNSAVSLQSKPKPSVPSDPNSIKFGKNVDMYSKPSLDVNKEVASSILDNVDTGGAVYSSSSLTRNAKLNEPKNINYNPNINRQSYIDNKNVALANG